MPLHPPFPIPERILSTGVAGSGKTTCWLQIAKLSTLTKSPAHFYVLDTDSAVGRMLIGYPTVIPNLTLYPCYDWMDYINALSQIQNKATADDWVVVDFISQAWTDVQSYFVEEVFDNKTGAYFLEARKTLKKDSKSLSALEGWKDWTVINGLYNDFIKQLIFRSKFNLYCTAKAESLSDAKKPTESSAVRELWLSTGLKPVGQKDLSFQFHTILHHTHSARGGWVVNTIKDRERQFLIGQEVTSFPMDYLVKIGGWKLA